MSVRIENIFDGFEQARSIENGKPRQTLDTTFSEF
jgi:hypothetical protein